MCASSCMVWAFRCSALAVCWRAPMPWSKIAGTGIPTPTLKKSPAREPGADFHRRSQLPAGLHPARHLEPHRAAAGNSGHRGAQERQDPGRHRTRADPLPLPARYHLQRFHVLGFPPATGAALPSPGSHSDSRQRLVSQRCRGLGLVRLQPTLAGSASPAALFAGVQPHRATVAIYPKECNPQSLLRRPGGTALHLNARLRRNAVIPRTHPSLPALFLLTITSLYLCADVYHTFACSIPRAAAETFFMSLSSYCWTYGRKSACTRPRTGSLDCCRIRWDRRSCSALR